MSDKDKIKTEVDGLELDGVVTIDDDDGDKKTIVFNPEAVATLAKKIGEFMDKGDHEMSEGWEGTVEEFMKSEAEKYILSDSRLNIPNIASLVEAGGSGKDRERASKTPILDRMRMLNYGRQGNMESVQKIMAPYLKADQIIGTDSLGGFLVDREDGDLIDLTVNDNTLASMCMQLRLKSNDIRLPTLTTNPTVYTVIESTQSGTSTATTQSNAVFGSVTLTVFRHGLFIVMSNEVMEDSDPQIEAVLRAAVTGAIGNATDWEILHGNNTAGAAGTASLVTGLDSLIAAGNILPSGGAVTYDGLVDMTKTEDFTDGTFEYVTNPFTRRGIMKMKDNNGLPIFETSKQTGALPAILGHPLKLTRQTSRTLGTGSDETAIYGGMFSSSAWCGVKSGVSIILDPFSQGEYNSTRFIVNYRSGFNVSSGTHFSKLAGLPGS